jgi:serine/threonine protein kinase
VIKLIKEDDDEWKKEVPFKNGDLSKRIKETKNKHEIFPDKVILNWIFQATKGLLYLHSMSVIHRHIKPE